MAIRINVARIACLQPAIEKCILCGVVIIIITGKISHAFDQNFLIGGNFYFGPGQWLSDSFQFDFAIGLDLEDAARFREALALFEIQTDGPEEKNYIGADGMAAGKGAA